MSWVDVMAATPGVRCDDIGAWLSSHNHVGMVRCDGRDARGRCGDIGAWLLSHNRDAMVRCDGRDVLDSM